MKYILTYLGILFLYFGTCIIQTERYHAGFQILDQKFHHALDANDFKTSACYIHAMDEHIAGYRDLHIYNPASWFEVNARQFGKECE